jgi:hypothetical protein
MAPNFERLYFRLNLEAVTKNIGHWHTSGNGPSSIRQQCRNLYNKYGSNGGDMPKSLSLFLFPHART